MSLHLTRTMTILFKKLEKKEPEMELLVFLQVMICVHACIHACMLAIAWVQCLHVQVIFIINLIFSLYILLYLISLQKTKNPAPSSSKTLTSVGRRYSST